MIYLIRNLDWDASVLSMFKILNEPVKIPISDQQSGL